MSAANVNTWTDLIYQSEIGTLGNNADNNVWAGYFNGSYDDAGVSVFRFSLQTG